MKIIDLLVKISKGEEVPKKFKDNHHRYELIKYPCLGVEVTNYKDEEGDYLFGCEYELMLILNDEVEIIEEEKEIEFEDIRELGIPEIDTVENQRICRAEYKINALIKNQKKIIDVINDMRDKE